MACFHLLKHDIYLFTINLNINNYLIVELLIIDNMYNLINIHDFNQAIVS